MNVTWDDQPWAEAYRLALLDAELGNRRTLIQNAKRTMHARIKELGDSETGQDELRAIKDALVLLNVWEKGAA
jgi:hypothetical protein